MSSYPEPRWPSQGSTSESDLAASRALRASAKRVHEMCITESPLPSDLPDIQDVVWFFFQQHFRWQATRTPVCSVCGCPSPHGEENKSYCHMIQGFGLFYFLFTVNSACKRLRKACGSGWTPGRGELRRKGLPLPDGLH